MFICSFLLWDFCTSSFRSAVILTIHLGGGASDGLRQYKGYFNDHGTWLGLCSQGSRDLWVREKSHWKTVLILQEVEARQQRYDKYLGGSLMLLSLCKKMGYLRQKGNESAAPLLLWKQTSKWQSRALMWWRNSFWLKPAFANISKINLLYVVN